MFVKATLWRAEPAMHNSPQASTLPGGTLYLRADLKGT